jgi:hypothetical protein
VKTRKGPVIALADRNGHMSWSVAATASGCENDGDLEEFWKYSGGLCIGNCTTVVLQGSNVYI